MSGPRFRYFVLLLAGVGCVSAARAASHADEYADARVCGTCHSQIARDYRDTGMARAFFTPTAANTIEDYSKNNVYHHEKSGTWYAMVARDGAFYQQRWQIGFDGKRTNFEELKIDYVLGSSNHSRSYVHRTARGTLIQLPLVWYSERGGYWGLAPGFDTIHPQTRRFISYECMFCHNAYPEIPAGHERPASEPVFGANLPEGIDCQRCHGPGAAHVRTAQAHKPDLAAIRASIVNPARLSPKLQNDVCMECHLIPTSDPFPALVKRFDRGPFSFRPGEPLENFEIAFHYPASAGRDKFEAVSSPYRLRQSRCFIESAGAITCESCHNPHHIPRGEAAITSYAKVCNGCHAARIQTMIAAGTHTSSDRCVECHMPKRRSEDAVHIVMTDHKIQRRPPPGDLLASFDEKPAEEYRGEVAPYYPSPLPDTADNALYRAAAQVAYRNNLDEGIRDLSAGLARASSAKSLAADPEFFLVLGDALEAASRNEEAIAAYEKATHLEPTIPNGFWDLAGALRSAGRLADAERVLAAACQTNPRDPNLWHRRALVMAQLGRAADSIDMLRRAITLDPELPGQYTDLADLLLKAGQSAEARSALDEALRIDPFDATAYDLSGRMLAERGAMPEALFNFEKSVRLAPGDASHLYDFAIALIRADRFDDAGHYAAEAVRADPKMGAAHELLGGLEFRNHRYADAAAEYRAALDLEPASDRLKLRLGSVLLAAGDAENARGYLEAAARSSNADVSNEARRMLTK